MIGNKRKLEYIDVNELKAYKRNARTHSDEQIQQVVESIKEFGFTNPVLIDENNELIAGHGRTEAAKSLGMKEVPAIRLVGLSETQKKALRIADNQIALNAGWDEELLSLELEEIRLDDFDLDLLGFSLDELDSFLTNNEVRTEGQDDDFERKASGALSEQFGVPPFSVLDTRSGLWQDRKRTWSSIGIDSGKGRKEDLLKFEGIASIGKDTSIFDPVLCELMYSWFAPHDATIVDPFAGGSVRGIVAAKLGRQYVGVDLRQEQVEENQKQWEELDDKKTFVDDSDAPAPVWHCGDSLDIDRIIGDVRADMVFSCPPYADLEKYSDDPKDLSNMNYRDFKKAYFEIIKKACSLLKNDSFACFVVGEVRDKKGMYRGFVNDTIKAFEAAGLSYYNEIILLNVAGSLPIRAGKVFNASRKIGKTHQNVLVFVKGDPKVATALCGVVDVANLEDNEE